MSKSLKKLIDINRLREFKNKLVGADSAYVQTGAVDQTVAGTKTFSKPIAGSVTGSSGSCTGNAATATNATYTNWLRTSSHSDHLFHTEWDGGYFWTYVTTGDGDYRAVRVARSDSATTAEACTGNAATATRANSAASADTATNATNATNSNAANQLQAFVNDDFTGGNHYVKAIRSSYGWSTHLWMCYNNGAKMADEVSVNYANSAGNASTATTATTAEACTGNAATATTATTAKACTGNAATATKLATARTIALSGATTGTATNFDGSDNITIPVTALDASKLTGTASVSTTGNAATATKAVSADSATNASHATSADKATKADQDGNGNNIVASYVAAGSEDSTTDDIGAFMAARPSFIKSFTYNNVWTDAISMRHRNGSGDGYAYGTYIRSSAMSGVSNLLWNHQFGGIWQGERTLIDSANLAGFTKSAVTVYDLIPDGAEAHNAMWGGRDITAAFNNGTVSANIANGTFKDIFPGDYITKSVTISGTTYTVNWVVADCDYWINKGHEEVVTAHHVAIVPQQPIFDARMNAANTTEGGYAGSEMYKKIIPACATGIVNAFGSSHILTFSDGISNSVDTSHVSSGIPQYVGTPGWWGEWVSVQCNLMSEKMVYGAPICSGGAMDNAMATRQMSAFRLSERLINYNRHDWWLRDVVSSAYFAFVYDNGLAGTGGASFAFGVRPFALLV